LISGCGDESGRIACEFSGVTPRDAAGILVGEEDPDDWSEEVKAAPNPALEAVAIFITLPEEQHVRVTVSSTTRSSLRLLVDEVLPVGDHTVQWDLTTTSGSQVDPGIYCVRVVGQTFECTGDVRVL
jgi:hypothetical protein